MNARDQDITDRFAEYTDKTVGELKEIDKINGRGGIFFLAREEEIRGDIDNFKPTRAYVWKPVFENNMPRNVHSIDEITANLPPHNDGRAAGYKEGQKIPVTLIFRGINSISPDDTVPQCKSQLTLKECCDIEYHQVLVLKVALWMILLIEICVHLQLMIGLIMKNTIMIIVKLHNLQVVTVIVCHAMVQVQVILK